MLRAILLTLGKEWRLLRRDAVGVFMLIVAPIAVIAAAGFSLANIYGNDPSGQTTRYVALVDEDHGQVGRAVAEALAAEPAIRVVPFDNRRAAETYVRYREVALLAIFVPRGTTEELTRGGTPQLVLYTDPVRYLETVKVELSLGELCRQITARASIAVRAGLVTGQAQFRHQLEALASHIKEVRGQAAEAQQQGSAARSKFKDEIEVSVARAQEQERQLLSRALDDAARQMSAQAEKAREDQIAPIRAYFTQLQSTRQQFEAWFAGLKQLAGSRAGNIPPPPAFPEPPQQLLAQQDSKPVIDSGALRRNLEAQIKPPDIKIDLPPLPAMPKLPEFKPGDAPPPITLPGSLGFTELDLSGKPIGTGQGFNTFDLHVPGFGVTFLLIGMLMGVSMALIDERDWGTLARLRSVAAPLNATFVGKLLARFTVGLAQLIILFAVGKWLFGISLGRAPLALLMPAAGISFAGATFGLIVAGIARTRDAVLPVGAIVIMTMSAIGGCWWPIDFEPRWMQTAALYLPTTWCMQAFNDLMIRRLPASTAVIPTLVNFGFGLLYIGLGTPLVRRRLS